MKKISTIRLSAIGAMLAVTFCSCKTEARHKQFILDNVGMFKKVSENSFVAENLKGYYTEISISFQTDSSFTIILWGDRNSIIWDIIKDKKISVSLPYDRHKGKNVDLDVRLMSAFKNDTAFVITKKEGLDRGYYGYDTVYSIDFKFEKQTATVDIEISDDKPNEARLNSVTDGYHWLHYFLSQEPNTLELIDFGNAEELERCQKLFSTINIHFEQEDKETAFIYANSKIDEKIVRAIAEIIEPRFANRERFFFE